MSAVQKSGILSEQQLNQWLEHINTTDSAIKQSAIQLSEDLLKRKWITAWHAKNLLAGKHKGFILGKYKLLGLLGAGGMSAVYLAEQVLTGQQRALKVLPKDKLKEKSYLARFYHEAKAVASLKHPNIVRVYDVTRENDTHYMVMEFIRGTDLHQAVKNSGPLKTPDIEDILTQTATALVAAHKAGMIHRDIKPANLLLSADKQIKILDMGLALLKSNDSQFGICLLYTSPSPRDQRGSRMPSSA